MLTFDNIYVQTFDAATCAWEDKGAGQLSLVKKSDGPLALHWVGVSTTAGFSIDDKLSNASNVQTDGDRILTYSSECVGTEVAFYFHSAVRLAIVYNEVVCNLQKLSEHDSAMFSSNQPVTSKILPELNDKLDNMGDDTIPWAVNWLLRQGALSGLFQLFRQQLNQNSTSNEVPIVSEQVLEVVHKIVKLNDRQILDAMTSDGDHWMSWLNLADFHLYLEEKRGPQSSNRPQSSDDAFCNGTGTSPLRVFLSRPSACFLSPTTSTSSSTNSSSSPASSSGGGGGGNCNDALMLSNISDAPSSARSSLGPSLPPPQSQSGGATTQPLQQDSASKPFVYDQGRHAQHFLHHSLFVQLAPFYDASLVAAIHQTHRMQYWIDHIVPHTVTGCGEWQPVLISLRDMVLDNSVHIVTALARDSVFWTKAVADPNQPHLYRFLNEFLSAASSAVQRNPEMDFFKVLLPHGLFGILSDNIIRCINGRVTDEAGSTCLTLVTRSLGGEGNQCPTDGVTIRECMAAQPQHLLLHAIMKCAIEHPDASWRTQSFDIVRKLVCKSSSFDEPVDDCWRDGEMGGTTANVPKGSIFQTVALGPAEHELHKIFLNELMPTWERFLMDVSVQNATRSQVSVERLETALHILQILALNLEGELVRLKKLASSSPSPLPPPLPSTSSNPVPNPEPLRSSQLSGRASNNNIGNGKDLFPSSSGSSSLADMLSAADSIRLSCRLYSSVSFLHALALMLIHCLSVAFVASGVVKVFNCLVDIQTFQKERKGGGGSLANSSSSTTSGVGGSGNVVPNRVLDAVALAYATIAGRKRNNLLLSVLLGFFERLVNGKFSAQVHSLLSTGAHSQRLSMFLSQHEPALFQRMLAVAKISPISLRGSSRGLASSSEVSEGLTASVGSRPLPNNLDGGNITPNSTTATFQPDKSALVVTAKAIPPPPPPPPAPPANETSAASSSVPTSSGPTPPLTLARVPQPPLRRVLSVFFGNSAKEPISPSHAAGTSGANANPLAGTGGAPATGSGQLFRRRRRVTAPPGTIGLPISSARTVAAGVPGPGPSQPASNENNAQPPAPATHHHHHHRNSHDGRMITMNDRDLVSLVGVMDTEAWGTTDRSGRAGGSIGGGGGGVGSGGAGLQDLSQDDNNTGGRFTSGLRRFLRRASSHSAPPPRQRNLSSTQDRQPLGNGPQQHQRPPRRRPTIVTGDTGNGLGVGVGLARAHNAGGLSVASPPGRLPSGMVSASPKASPSSSSGGGVEMVSLHGPTRMDVTAMVYGGKLAALGSTIKPNSTSSTRPSPRGNHIIATTPTTTVIPTSGGNVGKIPIHTNSGNLDRLAPDTLITVKAREPFASAIQPPHDNPNTPPAPAPVALHHQPPPPSSSALVALISDPFGSPDTGSGGGIAPSLRPSVNAIRETVLASSSSSTQRPPIGGVGSYHHPHAPRPPRGFASTSQNGGVALARRRRSSTGLMPS